MKAFHNDDSIKKKYLTRVTEHEEADEIIKGRYWENGKGCAVGCTIHSSDHGKYETELGIPLWIAKVQDALFEGMGNEQAKEFPFLFLDSINVGSELESIRKPFLLYIVEAARNSFDHKKSPMTLAYIDKVIDGLKTTAAAYANAAYANAAYANAAYAAADAAAAYAAYAAAAANCVAAAAAADAADAAVNATCTADYASLHGAFYGDIRENKYGEFADELLRLMRECK